MGVPTSLGAPWSQFGTSVILGALGGPGEVSWPSPALSWFCSPVVLRKLHGVESFQARRGPEALAMDPGLIVSKEKWSGSA